MTDPISISPKPIMFHVEHDGAVHFSQHPLPLRTEVDIHAMAFFGAWLQVDQLRGRLSITLDGRTVVYQRIGTELHGRWVCDLLEDSKCSSTTS